MGSTMINTTTETLTFEQQEAVRLSRLNALYSLMNSHYQKNGSDGRYQQMLNALPVLERDWDFV